MWAWAALAGLGAFHGINPAMGWLFAVARGLQAGRQAEVLRSLLPIALGHAASVALAVALVLALRASLPPLALQFLAALGLIGFGLWRLARGHRHRFRVGMVAGFGDLVLWSFLMATAHGAGLMLAPVLLALPAAQLWLLHGVVAAPGGPAWTGLLAVAAHTAAMLTVMGLTAWAVFTWIGLAVLRHGWINLDLLWSGVLIGVGAVLLVMAGAGMLTNAPGSLIAVCGGGW
jgi:hypothetical protein